MLPVFDQERVDYTLPVKEQPFSFVSGGKCDKFLQACSIEWYLGAIKKGAVSAPYYANDFTAKVLSSAFLPLKFGLDFLVISICVLAKNDTVSYGK